MSDPPPHKKLKQASIIEGFRRQSSLKKGETVVSGSDKVGSADTEKIEAMDASKEVHRAKAHWTMKEFPDNVTGGTKQSELSAKAGEAAERRREAGSPEKTPDNAPVFPARTRHLNREDSNSSTSTGGVDGACASGAAIGPGSPGSSCSGTLECENSPELFDEDILMVEPDEPVKKRPTRDRGPPSQGTPRAQLKAAPTCSPTLPPLKSTPSHTVLFKVSSEGKPVALSNICRDKWDPEHVKLPCSHSLQNLCPTEGKNGRILKNRWDVIQEACARKFDSSYDLEEAIFSYNSHYSHRWDFVGLHAFLQQGVELERREIHEIFKDNGVLQKIINLAMRLPQLFPQAIPLLRKFHPHSVTLSQEQIACLLANAFLCTFPRRNSKQKNSEYSTYPDINFNTLFQGTKGGLNHRKAEKLKCLFHYFKRVTAKMPEGCVTFKRQIVRDFPKWEKCSKCLSRLHASAEGTIEDDGIGMLQVDFANKFLGGGVLGFGLVQEEIRFMINPEMIISRLITEVLDKDECLIMTGCERFSNYTGYSDSFKWSGDHEDQTPRDKWGRLCTEVVAIDALVIRNFKDQFSPHVVRRELNKAFVGFVSTESDTSNLPAVATGNWGCGAFGGDLELKALIQLMAATEAGRDMCYFTFNDYDLMNKLHEMHQFLLKKELALSDLWALIQGYYKNQCMWAKAPKKGLFQHIHNIYNPTNSDEEEEVEEDDASQEAKHWQKGDSPDYHANTP